MYRVGDYVYFENSASNCYAIRRIEELSKGPSGNVEARVMCFYRRSEIPRSLLPQADKHHWGEESDDSEEEEEEEDEEELEERASKGAEAQALWRRDDGESGASGSRSSLPATLIRGKCSVTLLSEVETLESYGSREDAFFYALVYDPVHKTLLADRGEIRIGSAYQATDDTRDESLLEQRLWDTEAPLPEEQIDKFLIISRSLCQAAQSSHERRGGLQDVTLFQAHHLLHKYGYDIGAALGALVPKSGPMLCRDEMEDWSASEANLFEEAVEKYGKDFNDIRRDFLPWKSMKNIVEFFFMWKTTDRYVQQKRLKAIEAESKLKQVYVPPYNNKSTRLSGSNGEIFIRGKEAEAYTNLSKYSWVKYKKYGSFVSAATVEDSFILDKSTFSSSTAAKLAQLRPGLIIEPGSPAGGGNKPGSGKTRAAFYLRTTPLTRASRRICRSLINMTHFARKSGTPIDMKGVKADAMNPNYLDLPESPSHAPASGQMVAISTTEFPVLTNLLPTIMQFCTRREPMRTGELKVPPRKFFAPTVGNTSQTSCHLKAE
ncbi:MTA1like CG2244PBlike [Caligus rogercresseyi]|uniref:MTA1like CG2244PBlike n=1 Tax=Caligus rogercresseyi TaxID=217165 RepID=A0A7T8HHG7_CALRO|nr:MTA1like CG2244PBlike [Caligus rogercresseyi]